MSRTLLQKLLSRADEIAAKPKHTFSEFASVDQLLNEETVKDLFRDILVEISQEESAEKKPFLDNNYFYSKGDFNLALSFTSGFEPASSSTTLCANEFDLMVVNVGPSPVSVPLLRTPIDKQKFYEEPQTAVLVAPFSFSPYKAYIFEAFSEVPLFDTLKEPSCFLTVHSLPRSRVTWAYDRRTWKPKRLVAAQVADSRSQLAAQVLPSLSQSSDVSATLLEAVKDPNQAVFVRWEAFRSLCQLDSMTAETALNFLASDPDLYLQRLARETLKNLGDQ